MNGNPVKFIYANNPDEVDYSKHNIDKAILIDNTGVYRDKKGLSKHLNLRGFKSIAYCSYQRRIKKYSLWCKP